MTNTYFVIKGYNMSGNHIITYSFATAEEARAFAKTHEGKCGMYKCRNGKVFAEVKISERKTERKQHLSVFSFVCRVSLC